MTLDLSEARCQGRLVRAMGQAMLCEECVDCQRRTDVVDGARRMNPPQVRWWGCPSYMAPMEEEPGE